MPPAAAGHARLIPRALRRIPHTHANLTE